MAPGCDCERVCLSVHPEDNMQLMGRCSSISGWKDPNKWLGIVRDLQLSPEQQAAIIEARDQSLAGLKRCCLHTVIRSGSSALQRSHSLQYECMASMTSSKGAGRCDLVTLRPGSTQSGTA